MGFAIGDRPLARRVPGGARSAGIVALHDVGGGRAVTRPQDLDRVGHFAARFARVATTGVGPRLPFVAANAADLKRIERVQLADGRLAGVPIAGVAAIGPTVGWREPVIRPRPGAAVAFGDPRAIAVGAGGKRDGAAIHQVGRGHRAQIADRRLGDLGDRLGQGLGVRPGRRAEAERRELKPAGRAGGDRQGECEDQKAFHCLFSRCLAVGCGLDHGENSGAPGLFPDVREKRAKTRFGGDYRVSLINSRPISMRRISDVPAPIS